MDKEKIINRIIEIYSALNTLNVKGYNEAKTYSNAMDALREVVNEIDNNLYDTQDELNQNNSDGGDN